MSEHSPSDDIDACTRAEADVLSMIKSWPGTPAIVTYSPEEGWTVSTSPRDIERPYAQL
jgi:hypothetical protein